MDIFVLDGRDVPNPEDMAMLMAMYSRSPISVVEHLKKVELKGSGAFHDRYYVGYNHKSIGDCGQTAVFFEEVSLLAAKAIQDYALYNGQEASTRYLDMAGRLMIEPVDAEVRATWIMSAWMEGYARLLEELVPSLCERFPRKADEPEKDWNKAIKARAFDIASSLLPAGCSTFVAWSANLRGANDHLKELRNHPLVEVQQASELAHSILMEKCPHSFSHKRYPEEEAYVRQSMRQFAYYPGLVANGRTHRPKPQVAFDLNFEGLDMHRALLRDRPPKAELHQRLRQYGQITFEFPLDFAAYRDLQRHRSLVQEMPLLTADIGFGAWYLEQMPVETRAWVLKLLHDQERAIEELHLSEIDVQYYVAIGYEVPVRIAGPLPGMVYTAELRSGDTVRPTLRSVAQWMGDEIEAGVPGIAMHHDKSPGSWNIKRGRQDIVEKV